MYVGVYLCVSAMVFLASFFLLVPVRHRLLRYSLFSLVIVIFALLAFELLSLFTGLRQRGWVASWSYPNDYLNAGLVGWIIMLFPILGLLSPLLLALYVRKRKGNI
jgi:hypothetical protein